MRNIIPPFALQLNFLDPLTTKDGKPYGPEKFKQIVKERYLITKHTNTSYSDTGGITPTERDLLLQFISEDLQKTKEAIEESEKKVKSKKRR